jgi:CHASE3 domain sensor protein
MDVETGSRAFAVTGREPYLEHLESGRLAIAEDVRRALDLHGASLSDDGEICPPMERGC